MCRGTLCEYDIRATGRRASLFGFYQHLRRQIQGHDFARDSGQRRCHDSGTTGDVEDPPARGAADGIDETGNVRRIRCCWRS
jgi:hypothetical protein